MNPTQQTGCRNRKYMTTQHNKSVDAIRAMALQTGACKKINRVQDFPELIKLMFTPQGIEFCQDHNFPSVEVFRKNRDSLERLGVYVDAGNIALKGKEYVCIVGDTDATIEAAGTKFIHTIILMHGARAKITAKDYAVLNIVRIGGEYSIKKDGTVIVL